MKLSKALQSLSCAVLLALASDALAASAGGPGGPAEQRIPAGETAANDRAASRGEERAENAASGRTISVDRPSEWMMLLAGVAVAGWIVARRSGSLQE